MSQDQIHLPGPDMEQVVTTPLYTATTVRRLIAEAVAAEREACALVCAGLWRIDGQFTADEFAAAIRSRGDQT